MKKYIIWVLLIVAVVFIALLAKTKNPNPSASTGKVAVETSFYPLYFFASQIGGDKANVTNITPAGAEPHDYEPTPGDVASIEESRLLVLNGGGLEAWSENIKKNIDPNHTLVVTAGEGLTNQKVMEEGEEIVDPHVWLAPPLASEMVDKITQGFVQVDAKNKDYYEANAGKLKSDLAELDAEYKDGLKSCASKNIVTSHAAFGYLSTIYGLHQVPITGISPDSEPSPKALADIALFAKQNGVKYIFFESLVSPKLSETVAREIGAKTMVLDPIEGISSEDLGKGDNYMTVMRSNLASLKVALECK